ncbi:MAG: TIGR04168 family protein [Arthrospira sp. SH-MAG29]|nr:TIGR04168 family protein [Arthrospira sp. SH-MAG29]MBS0017647.1 TIGR04168 family protein [Arthrospira sp. SH-MAG29]
MSPSPELTIKIALIGDIHDQWEPEDEIALKQLGVDLALFVGDFGNEALEVVKAIAQLDLPKAVVFGNHDAWYSMTEWGRQKCPYDRTLEDRVQTQIDLLGPAHVGYGKRDFPELGLTVVGTRPFSWGGPKWTNQEFYQTRFGVNSNQESSDRILAQVKNAAFDQIIFLGHNGPSGLGDTPESPCGKDWKPIGGDYGDPDFAEAITQTRNYGKTIPLVGFGHMHHTLRHTKAYLRKSLAVDEHQTIYLNAASVPRIQGTGPDKYRHFAIAILKQGQIREASHIWVNSQGQIIKQQHLHP